jgi:hypothetical protein
MERLRFRRAEQVASPPAPPQRNLEVPTPVLGVSSFHVPLTSQKHAIVVRSHDRVKRISQAIAAYKASALSASVSPPPPEPPPCTPRHTYDERSP